MFLPKLIFFAIVTDFLHRSSSHQIHCKSFVDYSAKKPCAIFNTANCGEVKRFPVDCPIIEIKSRYPCTRYFCEGKIF